MAEDKIAKLLKVCGEDVVTELAAKDEKDLKEIIVNAERSVAEAKAELEANPEYQRLVSELKDVKASFNELKKYQTAKKEAALEFLDRRN